MAMQDSPKVVFVTGDPGVGKSTLANKIAERFRLPLFMKDNIKEPLMDMLGWTDRSSTRLLGAAAYEILFRIIRAEAGAGRSILVEAPFRSTEASPILKSLQEECRFAALEILCSADNEILWERLVTRVPLRHPGHFDRESLARMQPSDLAGRYDSPLQISSEMLGIDLSDFSSVDYESLFEHVAVFLGDKTSESA